ncbi:MAG: PilZ domain, partial [Pseudomonadota bacterium]
MYRTRAGPAQASASSLAIVDVTETVTGLDNKSVQRFVLDHKLASHSRILLDSASHRVRPPRMAQVNNARQWQRFAYPADVQLAVLCEEPFFHESFREAHHDDLRAERADVEPTAATAVDLSLGGVQLTLAHAPPAPRVGSTVTCQLPDGRHESLTLRGHVRWAASAERKTRIGVQFEPLSARTRQILQTLLSQAEHAGELVRVHLPNWTQPLQGVALLSDRGVRLRVPLPSFVHGSTIKFDQLEGERSLEGRVVRTRLRVSALTQGLELDLSLEPCEPARKRRYMIYEVPLGPDEAPPGAQVAEQDSLFLEDSRHDDYDDDMAAAPLVVPKRRVHLLLAGGAVLACALWFGLAHTQTSARRALRHANPHVAAPTAAA